MWAKTNQNTRSFEIKKNWLHINRQPDGRVCGPLLIVFAKIHLLISHCHREVTTHRVEGYVICYSGTMGKNVVGSRRCWPQHGMESQPVCPYRKCICQNWWRNVLGYHCTLIMIILKFDYAPLTERLICALHNNYHLLDMVASRLNT